MIHLTPQERAKLVAQGLIKLPEPELPKILRQPKFIVAPAIPASEKPQRRSLSECLRLNICCHCREKPSIYYGPVGGFGRNCEPCAKIIRAKANERRSRP